MIILPRAVDDDLARRTGMGLTTYTVLMNLSEAPERRLRMSDLAARSNISPSRMTRVVDALERGGLVVRSSTPENHRVSLATLTDAGLARLRQAWPAHLAGARELVVDQLSPEELPGFTAVVRRLIASVEGEGPPPPG
jgi:DNA-binding MarR family transcriptional regulator